MNNLINFLTAGILAAAPLLFGVLGETLTEKSGNMNLGVEGMMFMGGIAGILGPYYYEKAGGTNPYIALIIAMVCALVCAGVGALVFSVLTITLRANQNVTGLALTMFGTGFGNYFGEAVGNADPSGFLSVSTAVKGIFNNPIFPDSMVNIPYIGKLLFSHNFMVYLAILLAVLLAWFLGRTRAGLSLRAVGESPATADAAGINISRYKYMATCIGSMIAGLGGLYYVMDYACGVWSNDAFGDRGWLAIALVIFTIWRPNVGIFSSMLFGGLYILYLFLPTGTNLAVKELYKMLPYVVTIVVLVLTSMRNKRENQPPESLGVPYFREER